MLYVNDDFYFFNVTGISIWLRTQHGKNISYPSLIGFRGTLKSLDLWIHSLRSYCQQPHHLLNPFSIYQSRCFQTFLFTYSSQSVSQIGFCFLYSLNSPTEAHFHWLILVAFNYKSYHTFAHHAHLGHLEPIRLVNLHVHSFRLYRLLVRNRLILFCLIQAVVHL